jgi:hypothetical protein
VPVGVRAACRAAQFPRAETKLPARHRRRRKPRRVGGGVSCGAVLVAVASAVGRVPHTRLHRLRLRSRLCRLYLRRPRPQPNPRPRDQARRLPRKRRHSAGAAGAAGARAGAVQFHRERARRTGGRFPRRYDREHPLARRLARRNAIAAERLERGGAHPLPNLALSAQADALWGDSGAVHPAPERDLHLSEHGRILLHAPSEPVDGAGVAPATLPP